MPGADRMGFLEAVGTLVQSSWLPLDPYSSRKAQEARKLLLLPADQAATLALHQLVGDEELYERYLLEALLAQPGWAGLVAECEREPTSLMSPRHITLADYAAMTLITDLACLKKALGNKLQPLAAKNIRSLETTPDITTPEAAAPKTTVEERLLSVWQEAFEWSYYRSLLGGIVSVTTSATSDAIRQSTHEITSWAFFCIDDRECSLRRHVEETDPRIETFATAGFFGLDFMYLGAGDRVPAKHCPVPVIPRHIVVEESDVPPKTASLQKILPLEPDSNTFFRGWILSYVLGLGAMLRLAASVFRPSLAPVLIPPLSTVSKNSRLRLTRPDNQQGNDEGEPMNGLHVGYTIEELADRVQTVLKSVGTGELWPKLVVFFGHGSSSVNNPYFAAYDCGACSGRPGSPNARAFAQAANLPEVRKALSARGIHIPDETWFVGALHDTSLDQVTYYDLEKVPVGLPSDLKDLLDHFQRSVAQALASNAAERSRRFETLPTELDPQEALKAVRDRSVSLFEPRPEYNHASNASCIIGRRKMTDRLFLDRRSFLNSYDPTQDKDGSVLASILSAVIPVCGGINLEYYFSRIDPSVYGAGSKLPQNVTGLIGVVNGIEGDLLSGLPTQMTEIHDPIRLIVVVEQSPKIALSAIQKNPHIFEWVQNGWVRYSCIDPETAEAFFYRNERMHRGTHHEMLKINDLEPPTKYWKNSLEAKLEGHRNLPIGLIISNQEKV